LHDALAVGELEHRLNGVSVARRGRNVDDAADVATAEVAEKRDGGAGRAGRDVLDRISLAHPRRGDVGHPVLALDPALLAQKNDLILLDDEGRGVVLRLARGTADLAAAPVVELGAQLE